MLQHGLLLMALSMVPFDGLAAQEARTRPDSGALVRLHTATGIERGRLLVPFRRNAASIRFCAYPGPPCDANTPADRLLEMRTDAIRSLEQSVGSHWREGAVIGGLAGTALGLAAVSVLSGLDDSGECCNPGQYLLGGIAVGGFFGAIGAMFTSPAQKWERVF